MSEQKIKAIYGTRDILPEEAGKWERIITTVSGMCKVFNYEFLMPPIFEATELFARGIGRTSDVVTKEMYSFEDLGGRSLTLRPEGTASIVRAFIEHSLGASGRLVKVWYAGPMFRQERPQAGRYRQFYQFGAEAIGSLDPALDAELIDLNYRILSELGVRDLRLAINSIGMPEDRKAHRKAFEHFVKPDLEKFCPDCRRRFRVNPLRMFDCKEETCRRLLADAPVVFDYLGDENREHFEKTLGYLDIAEVPYEINKRLVRGLDYYTRTAWEFVSVELGSQDSVSGGGRYDLLVEQLNGPPTPGIGFAAGIERILATMATDEGEKDGREFGFFILVGDPRYREEGIRLLKAIRSLDIPADTDYQGRSLKSQMKLADKSRMLFALILAETEISAGNVAVRNLQDSDQFEISLAQIYGSGNSMELGEAIEKAQRS
jgi:histidyl-tRNA synthetase